ncbi:hypothetical protein HMPREF1049_0722 [Fusobacterium necrophorum subsp. funduliforme ATCC 51357]|uniref:Uncharacterized protein n=1 Tax=Fusobacterium necrophorum subsp. funduliforme B35 TaxID=1226633 RepID=A0A0B4FMK4_9FUSO|nr:hypothetical protein HMPREF1049_0722 [Fusobacterium necrophorum subsp. funduliforme ATCC 51357]KID48537.1 hypothetical protein C095_09690 [Fusobacterium necrophorum subsp. funduliforme B35]
MKKIKREYKFWLFKFFKQLFYFWNKKIRKVYQKMKKKP